MLRNVFALGLLAIGIGFSVPTSAGASRVSAYIEQPDSGGDGFLEARLRYTARLGEPNRLRVDRAPNDDAILLTDTGVDEIDIATRSCERVSAQQVLCRENRDGFVEKLQIGLRDRRDRALVISTSTEGQTFEVDIYGGGGADVLTSRVGFTTFYAGFGDDTVRASHGEPRYKFETQYGFVGCGPGRDRVTVFSGRYRVARNCEHVTRFN